MRDASQTRLTRRVSLALEAVRRLTHDGGMLRCSPRKVNETDAVVRVEQWSRRLGVHHEWQARKRRGQARAAEQHNRARAGPAKEAPGQARVLGPGLYCHTAKRDAGARQAIGTRLEHSLVHQGPDAMIGNVGFKRFVTVAKTSIAIDRTALERGTRLAGKRVVAFVAPGVCAPAVVTPLRPSPPLTSVAPPA